MARPLRLEFPGALLHVTARGNEQKNIVRGDDDRRLLLDLFAEAVDLFHWIVYQYTLMTNHYHFVMELTEESLSEGMKWFNSCYAQAFNRRHQRVGHLFQGRYDTRLVEREVYLLEVIRYVALNPVRAKLVSRPEEYIWSGHRAIAGLCPAPEWLAVGRTLRCFAPEPQIARAYYNRFVDEGIGLARTPWQDLVGQIYLGSEAWVETMRIKIDSKPRSHEHPRPQRHPYTWTMDDVISAVSVGVSVSEDLIRFGRGGPARMLVAWLAWHEARLDLRSIAASLRIRSTGTISSLIASCEKRLNSDAELQGVADRCLTILRGVEKSKIEDLTP